MTKELKGIKVLIGPSTFSEEDPAALGRLLESGCEVIKNTYKRKLDKDELLKLLSDDVKGLIAGLETLDREVLEKSGLKVISRCGSGISNIDLEAAKKFGIKVCFTPYGPTTSVAELTVGIMICLMRHIFKMNKDLHDGKWLKKIGLELEGKTIAIIGFGRIGKKVAFLLKPFKVKIIAVDPLLNKKEIASMAEEEIRVRTLRQALPQADVITIHSSGERQIIGKREFRLVKKGAFLLNVARGGIVDEQSLIRAIDSGKIMGAWLDVFDIEPYSGPLIKYPQVILTPHIGSYSSECRKNMELETVHNLISAFKENKANG